MAPPPVLTIKGFPTWAAYFNRGMLVRSPEAIL